MKKRISRAISAVLVSAMLVVSCFSITFAGQLDKLLKETEGLESYLNQLTVTIEALTLKQEYIESQITEVETKIDDTQVLLDEAEVSCAEQYDAMKLRIAYLYESGQTSYLEALLTSESIGEMLNKFEYIDNIVGYDRDMLQKLQDLVTSIEELKTGLLEQKADLIKLRDDAVKNLEEAVAASDAAVQDLVEMGVDQEEVETVVRDYIAENGESIKESLEQDIAEKQEENPEYNWFEDESNWKPEPETEAPTEPETEAATNPVVEDTGNQATEAETTAKEPETTTKEPETETTTPEPETEDKSPSGSFDDTGFGDAYLIACMVSGECGYESYYSQWAVADLIMNEVESGFFGSTVWQILHSGAFEAVNWEYIPGTSVPSYLYYVANGPMDVSLAAAQEAISNRGASHGYMAYCSYWFYEENPELFVDTYGEQIENTWFYNMTWW